MDKSSIMADLCCMILSNMTRPFHLIDRMITLIEQSDYSWDEILSVFTAKQYNIKGDKLHYLGPVFSNLSRSPRIRRYYLMKVLLIFISVNYIVNKCILL